MISFEDLKKIERSAYADRFRKGILNLASRLLRLRQERSLADFNSLGALSEGDLQRLEGFRNGLRDLVNGDDGEKRAALEKLKELPAFLNKKAFENQVYAPTMLERLYEAELGSLNLQEKKQQHEPAGHPQADPGEG